MILVNNNNDVNIVDRALKIVDFTNMKLENWYGNVLLDYGVRGEAFCVFDKATEAINIKAVEIDKNNEKKELMFVKTLFGDETIDYIYNIWMANPTYDDGAND